MLLFVYGTLMKNMDNHHLLSNASFIGEAETADKHSLYICDLVIPKLICKPNYNVKGELYKIKPDDCRNLFKKESKYKILKIKVKIFGSITNAYTFIFPSISNRDILLTQGDYREYMNDFM